MIVKFNLFEKQLSLFDFPRNDKDIANNFITKHKLKFPVSGDKNLSDEFEKWGNYKVLNEVIYDYLKDECEPDSSDFLELLIGHIEILFDYIRENPDNISDIITPSENDDKAEKMIEYIQEEDPDNWYYHIDDYFQNSDNFTLYFLKKLKPDLFNLYDTEYYDKLERSINNSDDPKRLQIFRSITLDELDKLQKNYNGVGIYWSYDFDGAQAHCGHQGNVNREFILDGWVYTDAINWESTIYKSIYQLRNEKEIELNENAPIQINSIYMKSLHYNLLDDKNEFEKIKKMFNLKDEQIEQHLYGKWKNVSIIEFEDPYWVKA